MQSQEVINGKQAGAEVSGEKQMQRSAVGSRYRGQRFEAGKEVTVLLN